MSKIKSMSKTTTSTILLLFIFAVCYGMGQWLIPFIIGIVFAYILHVPSNKISELLRISKTFSALIVVSALITVCVLFTVFMIPIIKNATYIAITKFPSLIEMIPGVVNSFIYKFNAWVGKEIFSIDISKTFADYIGKIINTIPSHTLSFLNTGMTLMYILVYLFMIPIITFYLLKDWHKIEKYTISLFQKATSQKVINVIQNINQNLGRYLVGQIAVCVILGVLYTLSLYFIGLEDYLFCGLFSGLMSFVPFLGPLISFIITIVIAISHYSSMQYLLTGILYVIIPFLDSNFVTPKLIGNKIGIPPFWILFSICATVSIIGLAGVFIAVPVAVVFATICKSIIKNMYA